MSSTAPAEVGEAIVAVGGVSPRDAATRVLPNAAPSSFFAAATAAAGLRKVMVAEAGLDL